MNQGSEQTSAGRGGQEESRPIALPASVAGLRIPDSALARAAAELVAASSPAFLYQHCLRTYAFAGLLLQKRGLRWDEELVFVSSAMHDLGLVEAFMTPTGRFEVDGADAAVAFLRGRGVPEERAAVVWDAIAFHSAIGIVERKAPELAAVGLGASADVAGLRLDDLAAEDVAAVVAAFPRLGFKQRMTEQLLALCRKKPLAQVGQFTAEFGRRHIPDFACPHLEDVVRASPFAE